MRASLLILLIASLCVSACGFHSVYGKQNKHSDTSKVFGGVSVKASSPQVRDRQQLKTELEDVLNPDGVMPSNPQFSLDTNLIISEVAIGVSRDATVSRYNLYFDSTYSLTRLSDNKVITRGSIRQVGSYNNGTNAYFSTYISRDDGMKRGISELAQLYRMRLSAYLAEGAPEQNIKPPKELVPAYPNASWSNSNWNSGAGAGNAPVPGAIAIPR